MGEGRRLGWRVQNQQQIRWIRSLCSPKIKIKSACWGASQVTLGVKKLPASAGDVRDTSSIPGSGRIPGEGYNNPLQHSCLEKSMERGAWWATVCGVAQSWT